MWLLKQLKDQDTEDEREYVCAIDNHYRDRDPLLLPASQVYINGGVDRDFYTLKYFYTRFEAMRYARRVLGKTREMGVYAEWVEGMAKKGLEMLVKENSDAIFKRFDYDVFFSWSEESKRKRHSAPNLANAVKNVPLQYLIQELRQPFIQKCYKLDVPGFDFGF